MWGYLVEMVRKMEPFWSRILEWFDAQARLQCSLHRAANPSKPVRLWSENKSRMMHWYNPTLKRSAGVLFNNPFLVAKKSPAIWATLECVMKFWVLPTPLLPSKTCAAVFQHLEFDNPRRKTAVAKLAKGLVSQRWKFSKKKPAETNG